MYRYNNVRICTYIYIYIYIYIYLREYVDYEIPINTNSNNDNNIPNINNNIYSTIKCGTIYIGGLDRNCTIVNNVNSIMKTTNGIYMYACMYVCM